MAQVVSARWDDVAYAAARVGHVAVEARDDVHMQVEDRLAAGRADVDADVEAVGDLRMKTAQDRVAGDRDRRGQLGLLGGRGLEPGRDVPARDEERVRGGDGEGVPEAEGEGAFVEDAVLGDSAERAIEKPHPVGLVAH